MKDFRTYLPEDAAARETARNFDDACAASGLSNEAIGTAIGCGESYVRAMRSGAKPIPARCELQLPEAVALPFAAAQAATRERLYSPPTAATVEGQALAVGAAAVALATEVLTAMGNDGKIDPAELLRILARHVDVARMDHKLRVIAGGSR